MKDRAVLRSIENQRDVSSKTDREFLHEYQRWLLLALKEAGRLDEPQYRYAEEKLDGQFRRGR